MPNLGGGNTKGTFGKMYWDHMVTTGGQQQAQWLHWARSHGLTEMSSWCTRGTWWHPRFGTQHVLDHFGKPVGARWCVKVVKCCMGEIGGAMMTDQIGVGVHTLIIIRF